MDYKPIIGDSGFFTLKSPYDVLLTPKTFYTVQSVRTINDFIASGQSVYDKYYSPLGVSMDQYNQDLFDNVYIVGLQAGTGELAYVPSSFIAGAPDNNGVKYIPVVIGVSLGAIQDSYNLESIISQIQSIITNTLGIDDAQVKGVVVGSPKWFTTDESDLLEAARKQKISTSQSPTILINYLQDQVNQQQEVIEQYEKIFKLTVPT